MAKGSTKDQGPKSALEASFKAYEAGDMVQARQLANQVVARASQTDRDAAKKVAAEVMVGHADADAPTVAAELRARTRPGLKPYAVAGVVVVLWGLLALFASTRT